MTASALAVRLIGPPAIVDASGDERVVRGRQPWAVLARLLLSERPVRRRELAAELFSDAADPLAALRWCLSELRKAFGSPEVLVGDPLTVTLPAEVTVDLFELAAGRFEVAAAAGLLDGVDPRCSAEFETWLLVQRQRIASSIDELLRRQIIAALAEHRAAAAVNLAELLARRCPFDEGAHVLLVKSLVAGGHHDAAVAHVEGVEARLRAELGVDCVALRSAARRSFASAPVGVPARAMARSQCEAGVAAIAVGATDAGLDCLRRAAHDADSLGDVQLRARCRFELGSALVHAVRGHDDEGAVLLYQAATLAEGVGDRDTAAGARRELGCVDALVGRRTSAEEHLARGIALAEGDADLLAGLRSVRAFNLGDWGRLQESIAEYHAALDLARIAGNTRRQAWTLGLGGWALSRAGQHTTAALWLAECVHRIDELRWLAFRPWPLAVKDELDILRGDVRLDELEHNLATSCQLADPCWEGMAARNLALAHAAAGHGATALAWITEAQIRCLRVPDTYVAITAAAYATESEIAHCDGLTERAHGAARKLIALAARTNMDAYLADGLRLAGLSTGPVAAHHTVGDAREGSITTAREMPHPLNTGRQ